MKESEWQQQIIDLMHTYGWRVGHFRNVRVQRADGTVYHCTPVQADGAGFPDLVALRDEREIVVEAKMPGNKPTDTQEEWLDAFRNAGAEVYIWFPKDWEEAVKVLQR
jgi:hypothetical protein